MEGTADHAMIVYDESVHATEYYYVCSDSGGTGSLGVGPTVDVADDLEVQIDADGTAMFLVNNVIRATITDCQEANNTLYIGFSITSEHAAPPVVEVLEVYNVTTWWDRP
jgi:hypothetical protein